MPKPALPDFVARGVTRLGVSLEAAQFEQLAQHLDLVLQANTQFNLTSVRDRDEAWNRHVIDSLTVVPFLKDLPAGAKVIDVGSGAGYPGVPIAIARPDLRVTLLEATVKKARFLQQCVAEIPLPNVAVVCARAEKHSGPYDAAVCRALARMKPLLPWTLPLVRKGGFVLAMKGPTVKEELAGIDARVFPAYPPGFDVAGLIVRIDKR